MKQQRSDLGILRGQVGDAAGWWEAAEYRKSSVRAGDAQPGIRHPITILTRSVRAGGATRFEPATPRL
jgi:hypothetical protein